VREPLAPSFSPAPAPLTRGESWGAVSLMGCAPSQHDRSNAMPPIWQATAGRSGPYDADGSVRARSRTSVSLWFVVTTPALTLVFTRRAVTLGASRTKVSLWLSATPPALMRVFVFMRRAPFERWDLCGSLFGVIRLPVNDGPDYTAP